MIWLRALSFLVLVQATAVAAIPYALWHLGPHFAIGPFRFAGIVPAALGFLTILWCDVECVRRGGGTAAPYDPPRHLVAAGMYRLVRNPMYVGATGAILGLSLLSQSVFLVVYAVLVALGCHLLLVLIEEPRLASRFGESYAEYCTTVPRWIPQWPSQRRGNLTWF